MVVLVVVLVGVAAMVVVVVVVLFFFLVGGLCGQAAAGPRFYTCRTERPLGSTYVEPIGHSVLHV